jgi:hypothetical protein
MKLIIGKTQGSEGSRERGGGSAAEIRDDWKHGLSHNPD